MQGDIWAFRSIPDYLCPVLGVGLMDTVLPLQSWSSGAESTLSLELTLLPSSLQFPCSWLQLGFHGTCKKLWQGQMWSGEESEVAGLWPGDQAEGEAGICEQSCEWQLLANQSQIELGLCPDCGVGTAGQSFNLCVPVPASVKW